MNMIMDIEDMEPTQEAMNRDTTVPDTETSAENEAKGTKEQLLLP